MVGAAAPQPPPSLMITMIINSYILTLNTNVTLVEMGEKELL
jgi:hypothetical protein